MSRLARHLIAPTICWLAWIAIAAGQTKPASAPQNSDSTALSSRQMFEEAHSYASTKLAELEKQKAKIDERVRTKLQQEQRDLAARDVELLRRRGVPVGEDLYYFGRLQSLAGDSAAALDSLRLFIIQSAYSDLAQLARPVAISCALRQKLIAEAELIAADFEARGSAKLEERFGIENQLAWAYRQAADFEGMEKHAKAMYKMSKHAVVDKACKGPQCEQMLVTSVALTAEAYFKQNRPDDAQAVFAPREVRIVATIGVAVYAGHRAIQTVQSIG